MKHIVNIFFLSCLLLFLTTSTIFSQDLTGLTFCIDPGHSPNSENQGPGGVGEYTVNLKVARFLETYLIAANADSVIITIPEKYSSLSLSAREDIANLNGVDLFYSIHHDSKDDSDQDKNFVVLNHLLMPGEFSKLNYEEGSIEGNKILNNDFLRFEALAYYKSLLKYFEEGDVEYASLSGVIYKAENGLPINGAQVNIASLDLSYKTDNFDNGYFAFPEMNSGEFIVEVSAPGYKTQIDTVNIDSTKFYFQDFYLIKNESPFVQNFYPEINRLFSPYKNIEIEFNRPMNIKSVENALQIEPDFSYRIQWLNENKTLQIDPNPILTFNSEYSIFIDTTAQDIFNHALDSSPEDLVNEPYLFHLKTESVDLSKPQIISTWPIDFDRNIFIGDIINIEFNKPLDPNSINDENIYISNRNNEKVNLMISSSIISDDRNILQLVPVNPLEPDAKYTVFISGDLKDLNGSQLEKSFQFQYFTQKSSRTFYIVDDFSDGISNWLDPTESSLSHNLEPSKTTWLVNKSLELRDTTSVGQLNFSFQSGGLLDLSFKGTSNKFNNLKTDDIVGTYIFGDSSFTKFRFYFSDSSDGFEAGSWERIDWFGWKPVQYQIGVDSVFEYLGGNGLFNGEIGLAGIQLYNSTNQTDTLYFDDFFLLTSRITTFVEEKEQTKPKDYIIIESYPSPFSRNLGHNGVTFTYEFPAEWGTSPVNLTIYNILGQIIKELVDQPLVPGRHESFWNGLDKYNQNLPAGIYIVRVQVGKEIQTRRLTILN